MFGAVSKKPSAPAAFRGCALTAARGRMRHRPQLQTKGDIKGGAADPKPLVKRRKAFNCARRAMITGGRMSLCSVTAISKKEGL